MLPTFQVLTLVDITATGITKNIPGKELLRNQQRNWETVLQVLSLRTQPHITHPPQECTLYKESNAFGNFFNSPQKAWQFYFYAEHPEVYMLDSDPVGNLLKDFEQVPVIIGLNETAKFLLPIFFPYGPIKNIHIVQIN